MEITRKINSMGRFCMEGEAKNTPKILIVIWHRCGRPSPVTLKPVSRIFEVSDLMPRQGQCGKGGEGPENKGLQDSTERKRGECGPKTFGTG